MTDAAGRSPLGRRFVAVWAGQTLSNIGSTLSGVGIGIWILLESGAALLLLGVGLALAVLAVAVGRSRTGAELDGPVDATSDERGDEAGAGSQGGTRHDMAGV